MNTFLLLLFMIVLSFGQEQDSCMLVDEICSCKESSISCLHVGRYSQNFPKNQLHFSRKIKYKFILIAYKIYETVESESFVNFSTSELALTSNRIRIVSDRAFEGLKGLETLQLNNNRLQFIYFNSSLPDLTTLYLNNNELEEIQPDAFDKLAKLEKLDLSHNYIRQFDSNLATLKEIDLSSNLLSGMIPGKGMQHLTTMTFKQQSLTRLTRKDFTNFFNLVHLDMSSNELSKIDSNAFDKVLSLETLILTDNNLEDSSFDSINKLRNLTTLNLAQNNIWSLPKGSFNNLKNLKLLYLSGNAIVLVPGDFFTGNLVHLSLVDLSNNLLEKIDFSLARLGDTLVHLILVSNSITANLTYPQFANLKNLEYLEIDTNPIQYIEDFTFADLSKLNTLSLQGMRINELSKNTFSGLVSLRYLYLSGNMITTLQNQTFSELVNLIELDLSDNRISFVSAGSFVGMTKLSTLNLNKNKIKTVKPLASVFMFYQGSLRYLYMAFSHIDQLQKDMFQGLENVTRLRLDNNKITFIKKDYFTSLSNLRYLNLSFNQISSIELGAFNELINIEFLYLNENGLFRIWPDYFTPGSLGLLYLDNNLISTITRQSFSNIKDTLIILSLRRNSLTVLTNRLFSDLRYLFFLYLSNNFIEVVHYDAFDGLSDLIELDLSYNNIKHIVFERDNQRLILPSLMQRLYLDSTGLILTNAIDFQSLKDLRIFSIRNIRQTARVINSVISNTQIFGFFIAQSGLNLSSITVSFPSSLAKIDLSSMDQFSWTYFFNLTVNMLSLSELSLSNVGITEIGKELEYFIEITDLDLSHNQLITIKREHFKYNTQLRTLVLSHNNISHIQDLSFEYLPLLFLLDLSYNQLEIFNQSALFGTNELFYLKQVMVSHNLIKRFDIFIGAIRPWSASLIDEEIPDVFVIKINNNKLTKLPGLEGEIMNQLVEFDLDQNQLINIGDNYFLNAAKLKTLKLSRNKIKDINEYSFSLLTNLKDLDLSCNNLSILKSITLFNLIRLEKLNISHNYLKLITSDLFVNLNELSVLDLSYNLILQIQDYSFSHLTSLSLLYLNSNPVKNLYKTEILQGLENIKFFYLPSSLVVDQQSEQVILRMNLSRVLTPARYMSDIYLVFYESVGLINQYESSFYAYELSDCLTIINLVKHNIQLNLNDDKNVNKFLNECSYKMAVLFNI